MCIEAHPDMFKLLKKSRKCNSHNVALTNEENLEMMFLKVPGNDMMCRLETGNSVSQEEEFEHAIKDAGKVERIKVETMTFNRLMSEYNYPKYIDFLSLDIEGGEMDVLKSIDFNTYKFGFMAIENNDDKITQYLEERGYRVFMPLEGDILFVPKE